MPTAAHSRVSIFFPYFCFPFDSFRFSHPRKKRLICVSVFCVQFTPPVKLSTKYVFGTGRNYFGCFVGRPSVRPNVQKTSYRVYSLNIAVCNNRHLNYRFYHFVTLPFPNYIALYTYRKKSLTVTSLHPLMSANHRLSCANEMINSPAVCKGHGIKRK